MGREGDRQQGGLGLVSVLLIVFIVLKLTGNIQWSWWWVWSPLWISAAVAAAVLFVLGIVAVVRATLGVRERNRRLSR